MKRRLLCLAGLALVCGAATAQPSQSFTPGHFDGISISGQARVQLAQGDKDMVTVVGDSDAQRVDLQVTKNGVLRVSTDGDWKFWNREPVLLRVQVKDIRLIAISGLSDVVATSPIRTDDLRISISGKGDVRIPNLTATSLRFDISGAGDADLGGSVGDLVLVVSGAGKVNADKLKAREARVQISGAATSELWVTDELRVSVSGAGNVNYWGHPNVRQQVASPIASVTARGDKK